MFAISNSFFAVTPWPYRRPGWPQMIHPVHVLEQFRPQPQATEFFELKGGDTWENGRELREET